jgi:hypothetical protein
MTTALVGYGTNTASGTLATGHTMVTGTGAAGANQSTKIGTSTGWGEIQGTANAWPALGAVPAPTGNGWLLDANTLFGQQIIAGNWFGILRLSVSVNTIVADLLMRASKYNSSGGTYTTIGSVTLNAQTITTTLTGFTMNTASLSAMTFGTNEYLYVDNWANITTNSTGSGTATMNNTVANSTTQGVAGRQEMDTPGFIVAPATGLVLSQRHRSIGRIY